MATAPDGQVFITGTADRGPASGGTFGFGYAADGMYTAAYLGSTGQVSWADSYPGDDSYPEAFAMSLALSPDAGEVFVAGYEQDIFLADSVPVLMAYDAHSGARLWLDRFTPAGLQDAVFWSVKAAPGRVLVSGVAAVTEDEQIVDRPLLASFDSSTGAEQWDDLATAPDATFASDLAVSPDTTRVYLDEFTRSSWQPAAFDVSTGAPLWTAHAQSAGYAPAGLVVAPDGSRLYVTGDINNPPFFELDYLTYAFDTTTAAQLWSQRFDGNGNGTLNYPWYTSPITVSPDGLTVYVNGSSTYVPTQVATEQGEAVVAYDSNTGTQKWTTRIDDGALIYTAITRSPAGALYVSGSNSGGDVSESTGKPAQIVTSALDPAGGSELWRGHFGLPGAEMGGIATSRDGTLVFVGGSAVDEQQPSIFKHLTTIAYASGAPPPPTSDVPEIGPVPLLPAIAVLPVTLLTRRRRGKQR
jgi:outer membrane protein assembly factor BamB